MHIHKSGDSPKPKDILWEQINPDLDALRAIIANHFGSPCQSQEPLQPGAYARTFLHILQDGLMSSGGSFSQFDALWKPKLSGLPPSSG